MSDFNFYSSVYQKRMATNYLSFFLKQTSRSYTARHYPIGYIKTTLYNMSLFGDWLQKRRISLENVTVCHVNEFVVDFQNNMPQRGVHTGLARKRSAKLAVSMIHQHYPPKMDKTPVDREVTRYEKYLRETRGLVDSTIKAHAKALREFLCYFFPKGRISIRRLEPSQVVKYFQSISQSINNTKGILLRPVLKSYFRYLEIHGVPTQSLILAIPMISIPRRSHSPNLVSEGQLKKLLKSTDRSTKCGKRTYVSILCLHDLGMRIGDVAKITLDDIDWRNGTIRINNDKTCSPFYLPLSQRLGDALAAYIKDGRPSSTSRHLFLNLYSHSGGKAIHANTLINAINKQWKILGTFDKLSGTHIFRRSTATRLLHKGIPIKEIADFLGHNTIESTALYTQVDLATLRQVSQSWPV